MRGVIISLVLAIATGGCAGDDDGDGDGDGDVMPQPVCTGEAPNEYRIELDGTGLSEHAGRTVYALTEIQLIDGATCRNTGQTTIVDGSFFVEVLNRVDDAAYPTVAAFIDLDSDGACDLTVDLAWMQIQALTEDTLATELSLEDFRNDAEPDPCEVF